jgi:hypothetical protein
VGEGASQTRYDVLKNVSAEFDFLLRPAIFPKI